MDNAKVDSKVGGKVNHASNLEGTTDITMDVDEYLEQSREALLREVMGEPLANIGDESWVERMERERETTSAVLWAMDCQLHAGRPKLPPLKPLILISTPNGASSFYEKMYRQAFKETAVHGTGWVAIAHSEITAEELGVTTASTREPDTFTLEELDRAARLMDEAACKPSEYVDLTLTPQMAEIVGAAAVTVPRKVYDSVAGPFPRHVDFSAEL
jgi:hypothetical protein